MTKVNKRARQESIKQMVAEAVEIIEPTVTTGPEPLVTSKEQTKVIEGLKTKSAKIRYLAGESFSRSQIARFLDIRYQHVRNVLTTELKRVQPK